jgi:RNA polymerase sigma-70 factor (ECF subfamily)
MIGVEGQAAPAASPPASDVAPQVLDPVSHLSAVYRDYPGLRALILRRVRDPEVAADILQDAAVTTLEKLRNGEIAHPEKLGGYLYRVALNHLRNHRRKDRTALSSPEGLDDLRQPEDDPDWQRVGRPEWAAAVRSVLEELPGERDRELLVRFYLHDEAKEQICEELRVSRENFNRVIFRARNRFRELLEQRGFWKSDFLTVVAIGLCLAGGMAAVSGIAHGFSGSAAQAVAAGDAGNAPGGASVQGGET